MAAVSHNPPPKAIDEFFLALRAEPFFDYALANDDGLADIAGRALNGHDGF